MEGYATMLQHVEKEREEDLLDWVACASDIDESAMEDEQDGEWKTARNSRKRKEKPVEESEIQEGEKKKMHTSAVGAEDSEKEKPCDVCPSRVNRNLSFDRADASTSAQLNSLREKGEKGRVPKPNLGFNITKTMRSEDSKVILVRPIGMEAHTFTSDPVALARGIGESPFEVIQKTHIRVNKRGNLVAFELDEATIGKLTSLLAVKRLGKWTVNCSQPVSQMQSWGVIKGIHQSVNVEDIKASADCGSSELLSVARLPRYSGGIKEESSAVKLGFVGTQCPSHIYVGFTRYAVFPFNAPPRRCYRCQRLGHVAVNCNSPLRCLVCSGPHTKDECTAEPGQEKCTNCHQTHIASSKECPAIRNAAAIQKLQRSRVGFEAAKHKVDPTYGQMQRFSPQQPPAAHSTYSSVIQGLNDLPSTSEHFQLSGVQERTTSNNITQPIKKPSPQVTTATECAEILSKSVASLGKKLEHQIKEICREMGSTVIQRLSLELQNKMESVIAEVSHIILSKVSSLLSELILANMQKEQPPQRQLLLAGMIRNHFGTEYSEPIITRCRNQGNKSPSKNMAEPQCRDSELEARLSQATPVRTQRYAVGKIKQMSMPKLTRVKTRQQVTKPNQQCNTLM
ncbi:Zinc finger CCHC-type [Trinorchestia longiramus]|nr:Zinc finger CCHC-type [Trinorchestia longiramus]